MITLLLFLCARLIVHHGAAGETDWFNGPALPGHQLKLLHDGAALTAERRLLLAQARRSIYVSAFSYKDDASARETTDTLCAKAREGLDVRVFVDHRGGSPLLDRAAALRACGARVLSYEPLDWDATNFRETLHEKLLLVDGEQVILGGSGYANWYAAASHDSKSWHDLDVRVSGPAACWYHLRFEVNWKRTAAWEIRPDRKIHPGPAGEAYFERLYGLGSFATCRPKTFGTARVYPLQQNPLYEHGKWLLRAQLSAIAASHERIQLYSPYFDPDHELFKALLAARARGVAVTVLTNSSASTDEPTAQFGMLLTAAPLVAAGVELREWTLPGVLHKKGGLYDGKLAFFGSDNLDRAAHRYNSEAIGFTDDPAFAADFAAQFDADARDSVRMTEKQLRDERDGSSVWRRIHDWFVFRFL